MTLNEIRSRYLAFFKERGHTVIPSAPLVPENDPTTLFTGSGMQPLVPYLLGKNHPAGARLVNSQKAFRAMDIDEVGDNRHTTFFEMLGNWSLGDYFKQEQLPWLFEFLTDEEKGLGLDPHKLYVTVFYGDDKNNIPRDTEAAEIWKRLFKEKGIEATDILIGSEEDGYQNGMQGGRIFYYDAKKNWWSRAGTPDKMPAGEPGGPDSEVFYDFGTSHDTKYGPQCHPNCDCGRFFEIANSVFMQYFKQEDGTFALLPKRNVDFGGGLERLAVATMNTNDVFEIDVLKNITNELERLSGKKYRDLDYQRSFRIVADHLRAAVFIMGDGVMPSNTERGYFARRLIRRAVVHLDRLGIGEALDKLAESIISEYAQAYPDLMIQISRIQLALLEEERKFRKTLKHGEHELEKAVKIFVPEDEGNVAQNIIEELEKSLPIMRRYIPGEQMPKHNMISGEILFHIFTTFGFPAELSLEEFDRLRQKKGLKPLTAERKESLLSEYSQKMQEHQAKSRAGAEQKFKGGLADTAEKTVRLHTAHHLLLRALQIVLGEHVKQRGSNITQERLRIDFSHDGKMTPEQLKEVERIVNEKIDEDLPVIRSEMSRDEAERLGAEHEFGQKYPERVSVYSVGPKGATIENPQFDQRFSIEFCGGPHVNHTAELAEGGKHFKIQKEEAVSQGVRRIKAVLE